jgi:hypothetical protein
MNRGYKKFKNFLQLNEKLGGLAELLTHLMISIMYFYEINGYDYVTPPTVANVGLLEAWHVMPISVNFITMFSPTVGERHALARRLSFS